MPATRHVEGAAPDATLVVVGASLAGLRAVESARRNGHAGPIVLVGAETHLPYDRPPLSKAALDPETDLDSSGAGAPFHPLDHLSNTLAVQVRLGQPATALDTSSRHVLVGEDAIGYDMLVIATGCHARRLAGQPDVAGVHTLRTVDDALAVRAGLDSGARTVVVGAGFIGSEVASAARRRGLPVTVLEAAPTPLARALGAEGARACVAMHHDAGTDLRLGAGVAAVEHTGARVTGVTLDEGTRLPADLVVVGVGAAPSTTWLSDSGVTLHERDRGVVTDATLWTGVPGVWAAGDVVHAPNPLFDDDVLRVEHWTSAAEQGAAAAAHALSPHTARALAPVPYFWSDIYGHRLQFVGIPDADDVTVLDPGDDSGVGYCALYRRGDRAVGALTIDRPRDIMKLRRAIAQRTPWIEAVEDARGRLLAPR